MTSKELVFFMTPADEILMIQRLRERMPWLILLGDRDRELVITSEVGESPVQAWIPTSEIDPAHFVPSKLPPLIQVLRSHVFSSRLLQGKDELWQGRLSIVYDSADRAVHEVVQRVWRIVRGMGTTDVVSINPVSGTVYGRERNIMIGPDAARSGNLLASNAANVFYAPASKSPS
jgi:hypothetical protein